MAQEVEELKKVVDGQSRVVEALSNQLGGVASLYEKMLILLSGQVTMLRREHQENNIKSQLRLLMKKNIVFLEFWRMFVAGHLVWTHQHNSPCVILRQTGGGWALCVISPLVQGVLYLINCDSGRFGPDVSYSYITKKWLEARENFPDEARCFISTSEIQEILVPLPIAFNKRSLVVWSSESVLYCCELLTEFLKEASMPLPPTPKEMERLSELRSFLQKTQLKEDKEEEAITIHLLPGHPPMTIGMSITAEEWSHRLSLRAWAGLETFLKDEEVIRILKYKTRELNARYPIFPGWQQQRNEKTNLPVEFPGWRQLWQSASRMDQAEMQQLEQYICSHKFDSTYVALDLLLNKAPVEKWREAMRKFGTQSAVRKRKRADQVK